MSKKASQFQKKVMSLGYRGKEIFKPLNTGWIDEHTACVREWIANIFFYTKNGTTIMIDAGYNYDRLAEKMGWLGIDPASIGHILLTHQDTDHVGAVERDSEGLFGHAVLYLSEIENRYLTGEVPRKVIFGTYRLPMVKTDNRKVLLRDGEVFSIGDIKVEAILVPGHTWGHMVYLIDDAYLFTGDTIWFGPDGGYSFIDSLAEDNALALRSLEKLEELLRKRNLSPKVITGHTGWSKDMDFVFARRDRVCRSLKKQKPHDPSAPYDGYDESGDTEERARKVRLSSVNDRKRPRVLEAGGRSFDAVFVVMPCHRLRQALPLIRELKTKVLVLVGNNTAPAEMERELKKAEGIGTVLFGFQVTGGRKEESSFVCERFGSFVCERFGGGWMDLGCLHGRPGQKLRKWMEKLFEGTSYKLNWQEDMEAYLICHPAAILPIAYLAYICEGDLRSSTKEQRRMMVDASHEAYEALKAKGIRICPEGDDRRWKRSTAFTKIC